MGSLISIRIYKTSWLLLAAYLCTTAIHAQVPMGGLNLWLRADSGIHVTEQGVQGWDDLSGNQRRAVTRTTDAPQWIRSVLNGRDAIRFNGENTGMETPAFASFPGLRGTLIIVLRINGRSLTSGVGMGNLVATYHGQGVSWQFGVSPDAISFYDGVGGHGTPVMPETHQQWQILSLVRDGDTTMKLYRGGRLENSFPIIRTEPGINSIKVGFNGRLGGTALDSIPEVLNGDIAEIILYGRVLDKKESDDVYRYLTERYGLRLRPPPFWEQTWFYFVCGSVLLLLAVLLTKLIVQRKLRKELAELEKQGEMDRERHRISREMHDDIGAGLAQIAMMSEVARKKGPGENEKELVDIAQTSRTLVNNMSEIIWSLNPEYKTLEHLIPYLREQLNKQLEYAGMEFDIRLPEGGADILLTNEQRRNILLIVKEIVNNAVKYSGARQITVKAMLEADSLQFDIADNGCGFDREQRQSGNGLRNIVQRAAELRAALILETAPGKGTRYHFSMPVSRTT